MHAFDYIIVGAGSAGCVLANRLSASGSDRVLLLEAGPRDTSPLIGVPAGFYKLLTNKRYNWGFSTEPEAGTNYRRIASPRGKTLGGSSAINGLLYVRGQPLDYDLWAQFGNQGWSYEAVKPFFKRAETYSPGGGEARGDDGPLGVSITGERHELLDAFIAAAVSAGFRENQDYNSGDQEGFGYYQMTAQGGRRSSAAKAYLHPALSRGNLQVHCNAHASQLLFDGERNVNGVEYMRDGKTTRVRCNKEVILSAGAAQSPQLLELSGIGDPALLAQHGIPVRHALPGVGENYRDHYGVRMRWRIKNTRTLNEKARGLSLLGEIARYAFTRRGILTYGAGAVFGFVKSRPELDTPDVQYHLAHATYADPATRELEREPGMTLAVCQLRPESRGSIHVKSSDPFAAPAIRGNFLSEEQDIRSLIDGIHVGRRIAAAAPLDPYRVYEMTPGAQATGREHFESWARETGQTLYHMAGTAKMGPATDRMAVVDNTLRVHGIDGLRVIDASIMPTLVSGNTNAAAIMIGERGAEFILDGAPNG